MPERTQRQIIGRYGALKSWSTTVDRSARTRSARENSPSADRWHLERLPEQFDNVTDSQRQQAAQAARKAYYAELAMKSAAARRRGGEAA